MVATPWSQNLLTFSSSSSFDFFTAAGLVTNSESCKLISTIGELLIL